MTTPDSEVPHDFHIYDAENGWEVAKVNEDSYILRNVVNHATVEVDHATWDQVRSGEVDEQDLLKALKQ